MDSYWRDEDKRRPRRGGFLLTCLCCVLLSSLASWAVCSFMLAGDNPATAAPMQSQTAGDTANESTDVVNEWTDVDYQNHNAITVGKEVSPAVVFISNIQNVRTFMHPYGWGGGQVTEAVASTGSGVIYSADGYIITNNHVVAGAEKISVTLYNGDSYIAEVVGTDERTDLAVIKIQPDEQLTVAEFGDSDKLVVGEVAIAIGNPGGENFANSLTQGVISGLDRSVSTSDGTVLTVLQTDAAINPGNSGGALCNAEGQVIGINTIKISMTGYEGMGFAIPSNDVLNICGQLMTNGKVTRPALGVDILADVTPQIAYYNDLSVDYGVLVMPTRGSAAEQAGLQAYDIVVAVDGVEISTYSELQSMIFAHEIGDAVVVTVVRGDGKLDLEVTLQELAG
ncbi:MAG: trypsin-like peptidase domain-containing protein [Firmicutes bacterium]|nr:trypsin-like peptidase domain-containing protein [Bacillota bacterium]